MAELKLEVDFEQLDNARPRLHSQPTIQRVIDKKQYLKTISLATWWSRQEVDE